MLFDGKIKKTAAKRRKNVWLFVLITIVAFTIIVWLVTNGSFGIGRKHSVSGPTSRYSNRLVSYAFYPSDYDLDVTTVDEYMQLDRLLHYKNGALTLGLTKEDLSGTNDAVKFFSEYFETVIKGDYETYNSFFTDKYYQTEDPYISFAPQMIYNIEIEQLSESPQSDGSTNWIFYVSYMIYRNDGSFRNDIPSDAIRKLRYELIENHDGQIMIDRICYYLDN